MSDKPADIPQDVWDSAKDLALGMLSQTQSCGCDSCVDTATLSHARAIMAATDRAALIAETHMLGNKHVAAAIRQGSQPSNVIPHEGVVR